VLMNVYKDLKRIDHKKYITLQHGNRWRRG